MRLHVLQHVPYETPAAILGWAVRNGSLVTVTRLYRNPAFPDPADFDALVVMGGPMSVHDEKEYLWLNPEKRFLEKSMEADKSILGVCLGAQLLAHVLGARVRRNAEKEIGWFPVRWTPEGKAHPLFRGLPDTFHAFHWHGDMFEIPEQAARIAQSRACANQGFVLERRVLGLQFHLEATPGSVRELVENGRSELVSGRWIQDEAGLMRGAEAYGPESNRCMAAILDRWVL